jgi:hypothetical protein
MRRGSTGWPQTGQGTVPLVSKIGCSAQRWLLDWAWSRECFRRELRFVLDFREFFIQLFRQQIGFLRLQPNGTNSALAAEAAFPVYDVRFHFSRS